jgi:hypothetical protein
MSNGCLLELGYRQRVYFVVFGMRAEKLYEGDLASEIESSDQSAIAASYFKPHSFSVQHNGARKCGTNFHRILPSAAFYYRMPPLDSALGFWMGHEEVHQRILRYDPHVGFISCSRNGNKKKSENVHSCESLSLAVLAPRSW